MTHTSSSWVDWREVEDDSIRLLDDEHGGIVEAYAPKDDEAAPEGSAVGELRGQAVNVAAELHAARGKEERSLPVL